MKHILSFLITAAICFLSNTQLLANISDRAKELINQHGDHTSDVNLVAQEMDTELQLETLRLFLRNSHANGAHYRYILRVEYDEQLSVIKKLFKFKMVRFKTLEIAINVNDDEDAQGDIEAIIGIGDGNTDIFNAWEGCITELQKKIFWRLVDEMPESDISIFKLVPLIQTNDQAEWFWDLYFEEVKEANILELIFDSSKQDLIPIIHKLSFTDGLKGEIFEKIANAGSVFEGRALAAVYSVGKLDETFENAAKRCRNDHQAELLGELADTHSVLGPSPDLDAIIELILQVQHAAQVDVFSKAIAAMEDKYALPAMKKILKIDNEDAATLFNHRVFFRKILGWPKTFLFRQFIKADAIDDPLDDVNYFTALAAVNPTAASEFVLVELLDDPDFFKDFKQRKENRTLRSISSLESRAWAAKLVNFETLTRDEEEIFLKAFQLSLAHPVLFVFRGMCSNLIKMFGSR